MIPTLQIGQIGRLFAPTDPLRANVVLLMDFEFGNDASTAFKDHSLYNRTMSARANAQVDYALAKFGLRSLLCDGSTDGVGTPDAAEFTLGTSDFCIETFINFRVLTGNQFFFGQGDNAGTSTTLGALLYKATSTNKITAQCYDSGGSLFVNIASSSAVSANTWYHIAFQRLGTNFSLHIDGVLEGTASSSGTVNNSSNLLVIGALGELATSTLDGNMDDVRFTVGATRYPIGGNFTPPKFCHPLI